MLDLIRKERELAHIKRNLRTVSHLRFYHDKMDSLTETDNKLRKAKANKIEQIDKLKKKLWGL